MRRGRFGVDAREHPMEELDAAALPQSASSRLRMLRVGARPGKQPPGQRAIVETGAADKNRPAAAFVDALDRGDGVAARSAPPCSRSVGSTMSITVMRNAASLVERALCRCRYRSRDTRPWNRS